MEDKISFGLSVESEFVAAHEEGFILNALLHSSKKT
jgi:hypothetical protein